MTVIRTGWGLQAQTHQEYFQGNNINVVDISLTDVIDYNHQSGIGLKEGSVLMISDYGQPVWTDCLAKIKSQNESNPAVALAWENVIAALKEYEMMVKLSKDNMGA